MSLFSLDLQIGPYNVTNSGFRVYGAKLVLLLH